MSPHDCTDQEDVDDFDDEAERALQRLGIVRVPGLAQDLLTQLAPLLAEEGIDLEAGVAPDPDVLNEALQRATERHNMELHTPTGLQREQALTVLRRFTELITLGDESRAAATLALLDPEESEHRPAISHVIGVSLGLLDEWSRDRSRRRALQNLGNAPAVRRSPAAADIVEAALRGGRAFSSLDDLTITHGGLHLLRGGAVAVAAAVRAIARKSHTRVPAMCAELLIGDDRYPELLDRFLDTSPLASAAATTPFPYEDEAIVEEFTDWLEAQPLSRIAAPDVASEVNTLSGVLLALRTTGGDPDDPESLASLVDTLVQLAEEREDEELTSTAMAGLATLRDFAEHRRQTSGDQDHQSWERLHEQPTRLMAGWGLADVASVLDPEVPEDERRAALAATTACSAVVQLLAWLGAGRAVTPSGWLRLADIQPVAAMLGIRAEGTRGRSTAWDQQDHGCGETPVEVRSMSELPLLLAWWRALLLTDVIELTATRVRPGPTAPAWTTSPIPAASTTAEFVAACVGHVLCQGLAMDAHGVGVASAERALNLAWGALGTDPVTDDDIVDEGLWDDMDVQGGIPYAITIGTARRLENLEQLGLVEGTQTRLRVPPALRPAVAHGLGFAGAVLKASGDTGT